MSETHYQHMRNAMFLVALAGAFIVFSTSVQGVTDITYCQQLSANTEYRLMNDIWFDNVTLHTFRCFEALGDNIRLDLNDNTIYPNDTNTATPIQLTRNNVTIVNGTINFTDHGVSSTNCIFLSSGANQTIDNVTCDGAGGIGYIGLIVSNLVTELTVENSEFEDFGHNDLELHPIQSEITSCGNVYTNFWAAGSVLSKTACTEPAAVYKDYYVSINCTQHSTTSYGALACSNNISIPADCVNISTEAWTVITMQNETALNETRDFTRYTCNPEADRVTYCDNLLNTCNYGDMNSYPTRVWENYAGSSSATSYHIASLPMGCIVNSNGNFSMVGRLQLMCKSFTQSGIHIDEVEYDCEHELLCYNSNTMEERNIDCTSTLTTCPYGCVGGVCMPYVITEQEEETMTTPLVNIPFTAAAWAGMLFSPFAIITMFLVGIGSYFEYQVKSNGAIFLAVLIVGTLAFAYLGLYPMWIAILITVMCGAILTKAVLKMW